MKHLRFVILALAAVVSLGAMAQERVDTVIPKFLINGYFFREMPKLPDAVPSVTRLKDKEGNSVVAIGLNVDLPKSVISCYQASRLCLHLSQKPLQEPCKPVRG